MLWPTGIGIGGTIAGTNPGIGIGIAPGGNFGLDCPAPLARSN